MKRNPYDATGVERTFGCGCVAIMAIDEGGEYVNGWSKACKQHPKRDPYYEDPEEPAPTRAD